MTTANTNETGPKPAGEGAAVWQPDVAAVKDGSVDDAASGEPTALESALAAPASSGGSVPGHHSSAGRISSVTVLLALATVVAVGGVCFAAGRATATGQTGTGSSTLGGANGFPNGLTDGLNGFPVGGPDASGVPAFNGGGNGGAVGAGVGVGVTGTVTGVTSSSITLKLADGSSVTLALASTTSYHSQAAATSSDVTTGSTVTVQVAGTPGAASGTGTATDVTITAK
jgi:hypothetical protein